MHRDCGAFLLFYQLFLRLAAEDAVEGDRCQNDDTDHEEDTDHADTHIV